MKNAFAGIFAFLFILTTGLAFVLYNVERSIFDPQLYIQGFEKENIYQQLPKLIGQMLSAAAQEAPPGDMLALLRNLTEEEWERFLSDLLPPGELKILTEDAMIQIMAVLNGENNKVEISLTSLKTHLYSPQGVDAIYGILKTQPDCTMEQLTAMAVDGEDWMLCNPPEIFLFIEVKPIIKSEIEAAMRLVVPDRATILTVDANSAQRLQELRDFRTLIRLTPIIPMMFLLLVTVIAVRSLGDWLNWWGFPLWFGGLFSMALILISGALAAFIFQSYIVPVFPEAFPPNILDLLTDVISRITYGAVLPTVKIAGFVGLLGMIMVAIAFIFRMKFSKG